jgi:hypothetical protein
MEIVIKNIKNYRRIDGLRILSILIMNIFM